MKNELLSLNDHTNRLIERGRCLPDISLWHGKMGIAIYMLHLSRIVQNQMYEKVAFELIDAIYENLSFRQPVDFGYGLTGIGCGIQYLISNGFIDADSDEILSDMDAEIAELEKKKEKYTSIRQGMMQQLLTGKIRLI